jgi:SagB-type dehydrogenase family enzyme
MEGTGFITNQVRSGQRPFDAQRDVGELFLANTKLHPQRAEWIASVPEYFSSFLAPVTAVSGTESVNASERVSLPEPRRLDASLSDVFGWRRSVRRFSGDALELADLATVTHAAAGITHSVAATPIDGGPGYTLRLRNSPSSGGLYGVDCYCIALRVGRLAAGVYKYVPHAHALDRLDAGTDAPDLDAALLGSDASELDFRRISAVLAFVGTPEKATRKYGPRGVRYLLLEAGMMAMASNLAATALGYGTLDFQSFLDDPMQAALGLAARPQYVLHLLLLGWPAEPPHKEPR